MNIIVSFLADPIVSFVGYLLSAVAAFIAISQAVGKQKAKKEVEQANLEITKLNVKMQKIINENKIIQGEKSQYFNENSGPVNIDNRN